MIEQKIDARKAMNYTKEYMQKEIADELKTSRQNISHLKNGRRQMQQDTAQEGINNINNNLFKLSVSHEFTKILPNVFDGVSVKETPLAFAVNLDREIKEYEGFKEQFLQLLSSTQILDSREQAKEIMYELIDVLGWGYNLLCFAGEEFKLDVLNLMKAREEVWKKEKLL